MADIYVRSGAAGSGTGADWANAYLTLAAAAAGSSAGDTIWISEDHAEVLAAPQVIAFPGTGAAPNRLLCANHAGSVPPVAADLATTASVATSGANGITLSGTIYAYGIIFNCGSGAVVASLTLAFSNSSRQVFELCQLNLTASAPGSRIVLNSAGSMAELNSTTMSFSATGQTFVSSGSFRWYNKSNEVAVTGGVIPTTLISTNVNGGRFKGEMSGLDLSSLGAGKTINGANAMNLLIKNCRLDPSVIIAATPTSPTSAGTDVIGSNSTTNVARNERYQFSGTLTTETVIKRAGGASDGTTSYSWKITTNADGDRTIPFETFEGVLWNSALDDLRTLAVHTLTDNVTLTDADIWLEVEYLGSSATPLASFGSDANATVLTTPANQTIDNSEVWTTTGIATPVKQRLEVTFTPRMVGPIRWRVKVARPSTIVYVCPKANLG